MSVDRNRRETKEITKEEDREMNVKTQMQFREKLCFRIRDRYEGRESRGSRGYSGVEDGVKEGNKRLECEMMMQKSENGN